jgi:hypothetical protein
MSTGFSPSLYDYPDYIGARSVEGGGTKIAFTGYIDSREPITHFQIPDATFVIGLHTDRVHSIEVQDSNIPSAAIKSALALYDFTPTKNPRGINRIYCIEALNQALSSGYFEEERVYKFEPNFDDLHDQLTFDIR